MIKLFRYPVFILSCLQLISRVSQSYYQCCLLGQSIHVPKCWFTTERQEDLGSIRVPDPPKVSS